MLLANLSNAMLFVHQFDVYASIGGIGEGFVSRLGAQGLLVYFVKAWGVVVSMVTRFRLITMGV